MQIWRAAFRVFTRNSNELVIPVNYEELRRKASEKLRIISEEIKIKPEAQCLLRSSKEVRELLRRIKGKDIELRGRTLENIAKVLLFVPDPTYTSTTLSLLLFLASRISKRAEMGFIGLADLRSYYWDLMNKLKTEFRDFVSIL
ncbi:MAG: hypothetical protein DRO15_01335 [Thermoprotei archaeon]|nr:MAG: hypothetical protein DRO15_01335 [Thermoprotei archaeon]